MNYKCNFTRANALADLRVKFPNAKRIIPTVKGFLFNNGDEKNVFFKITYQHDQKIKVNPQPKAVLKKAFSPEISPFDNAYVYKNTKAFKVEVQKKIKKELKRIEADLFKKINEQTIRPELSQKSYESKALKEYLTEYLTKF